MRIWTGGIDQKTSERRKRCREASCSRKNARWRNGFAGDQAAEPGFVDPESEVEAGADLLSELLLSEPLLSAGLLSPAGAAFVESPPDFDSGADSEAGALLEA